MWYKHTRLFLCLIFISYTMLYSMDREQQDCAKLTRLQMESEFKSLIEAKDYNTILKDSLYTLWLQMDIVEGKTDLKHFFSTMSSDSENYHKFLRELSFMIISGRKSSVGLLELLVKHGANLKGYTRTSICPKVEGITLLHDAVDFARKDLAKYLINEAQVNVTAQTSLGCSPLDHVNTALLICRENRQLRAIQKILKSKMLLSERTESELEGETVPVLCLRPHCLQKGFFDLSSLESTLLSR